MRPIDSRMPSSHSEEMITNARIAVPFGGGGGGGGGGEDDEEEEETLAKITISVTKIMTYHGRRGIS